MAKISKEVLNAVIEVGSQKVAQLADIGFSTLSKHIPNKEKVVEALIQREAELHLQILEKKYAEINQQPFEKVVETLVLEIAQAMEKGKFGIRIILTSRFAVERLQCLLGARESLVTFVEKVLIDAGYKDQTSLKAYTIVAAMGGMVETIVFKKDESISDEILAKETTKLVLAYCKA